MSDTQPDTQPNAEVPSSAVQPAQRTPSNDASKPKPAPPGQNATKEEPELRQEPSIPLDGKDEEGERLMEEMGRERREKEEDAA